MASTLLLVVVVTGVLAIMSLLRLVYLLIRGEQHTAPIWDEVEWPSDEAKELRGASYE